MPEESALPDGTKFRLTTLATCAGWAGKFSPEDLGEVLRHLPHVQHPDLLVGFDTSDDAAVYRLTDELCVVQTVDFFPPIVDDPYDFGAIAAANAFSDVYAMGGTPLLALNTVCFPEDLDRAILIEILRGGADVAAEAGVLIAGGHTIKDKEPKYGMAVTGTVHPDRVVTNAKARPGDQLVLTKPIGTGIIATAAKAQATDAATLAGAVASMRLLNRAAAEAMLAVGPHAATDVTGFGLAGHLVSMMKASKTTGHLHLGSVPLLPGARELAEGGFVPGGSQRNLESLASSVRWHADLTEDDRLILCDAQTSGGLLISLAADRVPALLAELRDRDTLGAVVGAVTEGGGPGDVALEATP